MSKSDDKATEDMTAESSAVENSGTEGSAAEKRASESSAAEKSASSTAATGAAESPSTEMNVRAARRAQREAERAARAQRKADAARQRAMDAARAGGLFEGMEASSGATAGTATAAGTASVAGPAFAGATAGGHPYTASTSVATEKPRREPMSHSRQVALMMVLSVVSVLLLVVTGLATWQYIEARDATATEEQIANAPTAATDAARDVATQMFTYDHRTVDEDLAAVRASLTDPALAEFVEQSMPTVASAAKQQEATVYATVAAAAPQEVVDQDNVTVLVMLNRMVSTKDTPEAASSASRLSMEMKREGDIWKLAKLNAL